jgi:hypothetical protein
MYVFKSIKFISKEQHLRYIKEKFQLIVMPLGFFFHLDLPTDLSPMLHVISIMRLK